jgi:hypothetical protein
MASTYLTRAATNSVTSSTTFTISAWIKRTLLDSGGSADHWFMHENASGHTQKLDLHFVNDEFRMGWWDGSNEYNLDSVMKFLDTNAWYHIVFRCDTTQATASNRVRVYVNGEQIALQQIGGGSPDSQQPAQNATMNLGQKTICIGRYQSTSPGQYFNGCMSHMHYCDGQSYAPTAFGSTDATTGEWQINPDPGLTYGNNGFWLFKDDNAVTNQAGNSSGNFTTSGGVVTKTEDNPSNNFATLNSIMPTGGGFAETSAVFANGATQFTTSNSSSNYGTGLSTLGMTSGKYYAECKVISGGQGLIGIRGWQGTSSNNYLGDTPKDYGMYYNGRVYNNNTMVLDTSTSYTNNDIIGVFVDCDNWKIYWSKNGTMMNTTGYTIGDITADNNARSLGAYFFGCCEWNSSGNGSWQWNFGNGCFGSAPLTGTTYDGSDGQGIFKYNPKNLTLDSTTKSFKALCTKGLNS